MSNRKRTVGVIGGMGPAATLDFARTVMAVSGATRDDDHIPLLIDNNTQIPNRQAALLGNGPSPGPAIAQTGLRLEAAGAEVLVMPCNTAHAFVDDLLAVVSTPFISIIDVTIDACRGYRKVGILATAGCLAFGGYQRAMDTSELKPVVPDDEGIRALSALVVQIKTGSIGDSERENMLAHIQSLHKRGCDAVISACTEIPLALGDAPLPCPMICSTTELAVATIRYAKGER
ncbi:MAG: amino acid racemase [Pseudomonadota bacterium]